MYFIGRILKTKLSGAYFQLNWRLMMNKFYRYIFVSILIWSMTIATNIFIIPKNIFAVDRVATFPIFEKASAYNGLAVNPIRKESSRAFFGF